MQVFQIRTWCEPFFGAEQPLRHVKDIQALISQMSPRVQIKYFFPFWSILSQYVRGLSSMHPFNVSVNAGNYEGRSSFQWDDDQVIREIVIRLTTQSSNDAICSEITFSEPSLSLFFGDISLKSHLKSYFLNIFASV